MAKNAEVSTSDLKRLSVKVTPRTVDQLDFGAEFFGGVTVTEALRRMVELGNLVLSSREEGSEIVIRTAEGKEKVLFFV